MSTQLNELADSARSMLAIYPTGEKLLDELTEFAASRLPAIHKPDMIRRAGLAEEWWIEEIGEHPCPYKGGWRFIYRFARDRAVERCGRSDGSASLLAHQLLVLIPTCFAAAFRARVADQVKGS